MEIHLFDPVMMIIRKKISSACLYATGCSENVLESWLAILIVIIMLQAFMDCMCCFMYVNFSNELSKDGITVAEEAVEEVKDDEKTELSGLCSHDL